MKTILHIIDTTGPGGAETVFIDLATRLPKEEYRSIVVIRGKGWVYEELGRRGVEPVLLDAKGSFNWRYLLNLRNLIRRENVDLIQSHLFGSNVYCSIAGLITGTPVVATFHGSVDIGLNERFKGLKFSAINMGASSAVPVSKMLRKDIENRTSLDTKKIRVIYNGIETSSFQKSRTSGLRREFGWSDEDIIIGSLGNIRPPKGYDILLRAASQLENTPGSFRFVIAGQSNSSLIDKLLNLREELGLEDRVQFLGFVDDPAEFLANLDIFLSSSISEGLPLSAIQAMVAKLPIVATRCGGWQELIAHQENGWLVEAGNAGAIAEAIGILAADTGLCERLSGKARDYAIETFDIKAMISAYEQLYKKLITR